MKISHLIILSLLNCIFFFPIGNLYAQTSAHSNIWLISSDLSNSSDHSKYVTGTNQLEQILSDRYQVKKTSIISNFEELEKALSTLLKNKKNGKCPLIIFYGHANSTPNDVHFHLEGDDLSIRELGKRLKATPGSIGIIWSAEAGRSIITLMKGTGHVIMAAAELEDKDNEPVMSDLLVNILKTFTIHSDQNKQVNLASIQEEAKQQIKNWYTEKHLIQLETILMDGNGDGIGTITPDDADLKGGQQVILKLR